MAEGLDHVDELVDALNVSDIAPYLYEPKAVGVNPSLQVTPSSSDGEVDDDEVDEAEVDEGAVGEEPPPSVDQWLVSKSKFSSLKTETYRFILVIYTSFCSIKKLKCMPDLLTCMY